MANVTEYVGNAGLGLGSNASIPAIGTKDLDAINQTADKLMAYNAAQNNAIYQQKIKDRDKLYEALDSGEIRVGDLLEQDMGTVKEGLQKLDDAYFARVKKGINDLDAAAQYKKALREAQDRVTQAQARKVFYDKMNGDLSKEKLPRKQQAMKEHLEKTINGGFFKDLTPYQQTLDFDFDPIKGYVKKVTTERTDPANKYMKLKETSVSVPATMQEANKDFIENNEARENQTGLLKEYQNMPPTDLKEQITLLNSRLKPIGAEISFEEFPDGTILIKESIPDFAAKWSMAADPQLNSSTRDLDKGALEIGKANEAQRHNKATEKNAAANAAANQMRARAYSALQNKKLSQMNAEEKRVKNFWDGVTGKVKSLKTTAGTDRDFVYAGDLPKGYQYVGGLDENGKPIRLVPKKTEKGMEYYDTKFYDSNGGEINLREQFKEYQKSGGQGSYDQLRSNLLKAGKINMELVGENGVGNFETAFQTARAISNKGTSKGEEPIFGEEEIVEEQ